MGSGTPLADPQPGGCLALLGESPEGLVGHLLQGTLMLVLGDKVCLHLYLCLQGQWRLRGFWASQSSRPKCPLTLGDPAQLS